MDGRRAGFVVARRQGAHGRESAHAHGCDGRFRSAGNHHVGIAALDDLKASPMEWALVVQAVAVASFGPFAP